MIAMFYFTENNTVFSVNVTMWNVDIRFVIKNMNLCICLLKEYYQDIVCGILMLTFRRLTSTIVDVPHR